MPIFDTYVSLQHGMEEIVKTAMNNTVERILDELQNYIDKEVYSNNPDWYTRTFEVRDNWKNTPAKKKGKIIESMIYFDESTFSHSGSPLWQHGVQQINGKTLLEILIGERPTGNLWGMNSNNPNPRDFWNPFIKWTEQNFDRIFKEEFNKL